MSEFKLTKMNFSELLSHNVGLALKLEIRWLHQSRHGPKHLRPFLSRNLSYIRKARGMKLVKKKETGMEPKQVKKVNVLLDVFNHRTVMYNDALLKSPRRATRKLAQAEVSSVTPVKAAAAQREKRKRDEDADDDSTDTDESSSDAGQGAKQQPNKNRTWKEKLAANDKTPNVPSAKRHKSASVPRSLSPLSTSDDGVASGLVPGNKDEVYLSSTARANHPMHIHYLVLGETGIPSAYVEEREDRRCPFCFHDAVSDTGIVAHLSASHGDNLVFKAARSEVGVLNVVATFDPQSPLLEDGTEQLKDFVFVSSSSDTLSPVAFMQRSAQNIAEQDLIMRRKNMRLLEEMGADEGIINRFVPDDTVPIRQYFHSKTYQPMIGGDWDVDSDEDSTSDDWLQQTTAALLDDFTDLDSGEKKFMKLWNQFIKSCTVIADRSMPERCMTFIQTYAAKLKASDLRQELSLHLHSLWDHGLISSDHVAECMREYD